MTDREERGPAPGKQDLTAAIPSFRRESFRGVVFGIAAAVLVVVAEMGHQFGVLSTVFTNQVLAVVAAVHGVVTFVCHGARRFTAAGLFMLASALFVGLGGLIVARDPYFLSINSPEDYLNTALMASALGQIGIAWVAWLVGYEQPVRQETLTRHTALRYQIVGAVVLVVVAIIGGRLGPLYEGFAFSAALLISASAVLRQPGWGRIRYAIVVLAPLLIYAIAFHNGTGRLRVVALFCGVAYLFLLHRGRRWHKVFVVVALPVLLFLMGAWRKHFELLTFGAVGNDTGLSSMLAPIGVFALVIHAFDNGQSWAWGTSFLSPIGAALPKGWVPEWVPEALGYQLVNIVDPSRVGSGFSTVASVYGEWWWNFSILGIGIAIPVMGALLGLLDRAAVRAYSRASDSSIRFVQLAFLITMVGGIGDLVWSGTHTWIVRMYARGLLLAVVAVVANSWRTWHTTSASRSIPSRTETRK